MKLTTIGGYDQKIIDEFNRISEMFGPHELLEIILTSWADDQDIEDMTEHLKNRLKENDIKI